MPTMSKSEIKRRINEIESEFSKTYNFRSFGDGRFCFELETVDTDDVEEYQEGCEDDPEFYEYEKNQEIINTCKLIDVPEDSESFITYVEKDRETSEIMLVAGNKEKTKKKFTVKTTKIRDDESHLLYNFVDGLSQNLSKFIKVTFVRYYDLEDYELMKREIYEYEEHDVVLDIEEYFKYRIEPELLAEKRKERLEILKSDNIDKNIRSKNKKKKKKKK